MVTERFFNQHGFWNKFIMIMSLFFASIRANTQITAVTSSTSCKSNNANL